MEIGIVKSAEWKNPGNVFNDYLLALAVGNMTITLEDVRYAFKCMVEDEDRIEPEQMELAEGFVSWLADVWLKKGYSESDPDMVLIGICEIGITGVSEWHEIEGDFMSVIKEKATGNSPALTLNEVECSYKRYIAGTADMPAWKAQRAADVLLWCKEVWTGEKYRSGDPVQIQTAV